MEHKKSDSGNDIRSHIIGDLKLNFSDGTTHCSKQVRISVEEMIELIDSGMNR